MIKIEADIIAEPLVQAIIAACVKVIFQDNANIASVIPLDKGKPDKYDVLNYRPVIILNDFSKKYKKVIENQLVSYFDNYLSPFVSAYRID